MADLAIKAFEREESQFQLYGNSVSYSGDNVIIFPRAVDERGNTLIDISSITTRYGIRMRTIIGVKLYLEWIHNGIDNPHRNTSRLCHAFLHAIDMDRTGDSTLDFTVPYFLPESGLNMLAVRARLRGWKNERHIVIDLATE
jgi:hypothetical protein